MSKKSKAQKKKRTKVYAGEDAAVKGVHVTRIKAVKKSVLREYWDTKKPELKAKGILFIILFGLGYLIFGLVTWIF